MSQLHLKWFLAIPVIALMMGAYTIADFIGNVSLPDAPVNHVEAAPQPIPVEPARVASEKPPAIAVPPQLAVSTPAPTLVRTNARVTTAPHDSLPTREVAVLDHTVARRAANDPDPNSRAQAIQQLAAARGPDAAFALSETLRDEVPSNRYLGIESLRLMAWNTGDPDGSIRTLLRSATGDADAGVAEHARNALEELTQGLP